MHSCTEGVIPATTGLWGAWGELNPALAQGLPALGEMPALPQLNRCPTQGKPTPSVSHSVCPFFILGQENDVFQTGTFTAFAGNHALAGQTMLLESVSPVFRELHW